MILQNPRILALTFAHWGKQSPLPYFTGLRWQEKIPQQSALLRVLGGSSGSIHDQVGLAIVVSNWARPLPMLRGSRKTEVMMTGFRSWVILLFGLCIQTGLLGGLPGWVELLTGSHLFRLCNHLQLGKIASCVS